MARREREEKNEAEVKDVLQLSKELIKALNSDQKKEKVAWCLATDEDNPTDVKEFVSTGSTLLDYVIANRRGGGAPAGKLMEIVGEEATGKSLLLTHILAETQRRGGLAVLIDEENALNPEFAARVGLDLTKLVYLQCGSVEAVGENVEKVINLARAKDVKRIITIGWDSVAATPPAAELEGDWDPNSRVGLQAKAIAKMMRKLTKTVGVERVTLVFTNQMKTKIGVMFGDPMGTPGGKAIPYHASVRVRLYRSSELRMTEDGKRVQRDAEQKEKKPTQTYAIHTRAKVIKNRLGPPLRTCEFDIHFARGIDDAGSICDYLHAVGEIEKAMGWCYLTAVPSGKRTKWRADKEEQEGDRGVQFKEEEFGEKMADAAFREAVFGLLDKHLVVKFDARTLPPDAELDPESLTDAEAVAELVGTGEAA